MFRFTIAILLINTCYRSLGNPIGTHITVYSLDNSLKALENRCENQFLVSQIKEKISECNFTVPPFKIKEMQCLIFYDINTQLCDAIGSSNLIQQNDLLNNLQNVINLDTLCTDITKDWKFTNFTDIPLYKNIAEDVFKNKKRCDKVCEVADITSDDSNNFCKYFKWGSDTLKIIQSSIHSSQMKAASNVIAPAVPVVTSTDTKVIEPVIGNTTVISTTKNNIPSSNDETKVANAARPETTGTNIVQPEIKEPNPNFVDQKTNSELNAIKVNEGVKKTSEPGKPKVDEEVNNSEKSVVAQKDKVTVELDDEKTILEEEQPPKKVDIEKEDQLLNNQMKDKEFNVDDVEDDMDSEEDEKPDLQDNSEISIGQGDKQNVEEKPKDNSKSIAPIITSFADKSSGEFISKMPQDEFEEDDDHFFSFFLTAVIIVVLLYILYHNKSKFTKVILGLIVEGRQTGRRRNSRGHAYRRLDTLEQAMSTNSPAPPSKIIY
ncbi:uncharacterized protein LOC106717895 [Papilio machaon]|uniref:uncharacterized protein LOC106717895 n=1 Tax=Papilio machaon TaxID=76193 RepID=UPI001E663294|nr:uncharacterized protein LOC106717895 [Papilio machaon]